MNIKPIDFHCHGIGKFDFTEPENLLLTTLDKSLAVEGTEAVLTLYLPQDKISKFRDLVMEYDRGRQNGDFQHIRGISLEGPMLSSFGGTPKTGQWTPTKQEWNEILQMGKYGLKYIVISPDYLYSQEDHDYPENIEWVIKTMLDNSVLPAIGHFRKDDPERSANCIKRLLRFLKENNLGPIVTDHLFNDMPLNFQHSFRRKVELSMRQEKLGAVLSADWSDVDLDELLGFVPASIVKGAKEGLVKICLNFDGDHVDLELCRKTVEYVGSENIMVMTDRIQSKVLGGQRLKEAEENTLLYQHDGVVAGGTQSLVRQIMNMIRVGIPSTDVFNLVYETPNNLLIEQRP